MPEVIETRLACDFLDDKDATRYFIDDGRRRMVVLLCADHAEPVQAVMNMGQPAPQSKPRGSRGLSEQRLRSLPVLDDE